MAKIIYFKNLNQKKYRNMEQLPPEILDSFGELPYNFRMIVWGNSGNGKSNFVMRFVRCLIPHGDVLYLSLEEGFEKSLQMNVRLHLSDEGAGIGFADHQMKYDKLRERLKKRRSAQFVIVDSLQYWNITLDQYKELIEEFPKKSFVFVSHADGKNPKGNLADAIRYDCGLKVRVDGYVAFVQSRYGGNNPFLIWEEGAKRWWGEQYGRVMTGLVRNPAKAKDPAKPAARKPKPKPKPEPETLTAE